MIDILYLKMNFPFLVTVMAFEIGIGKITKINNYH